MRLKRPVKTYSPASKAAIYLIPRTSNVNARPWIAKTSPALFDSSPSMKESESALPASRDFQPSRAVPGEWEGNRSQTAETERRENQSQTSLTSFLNQICQNSWDAEDKGEKTGDDMKYEKHTHTMDEWGHVGTKNKHGNIQTPNNKSIPISEHLLYLWQLPPPPPVNSLKPSVSVLATKSKTKHVGFKERESVSMPGSVALIVSFFYFFCIKELNSFPGLPGA